MASASFKVFFGDRPATVEELERIEEITIEQEMEMAWEARIRMVLCVDDKGRWRHRAGEFAQPFSRVRIEVQQGEEGFSPLIDGPVAGFATELSSSPGTSVVNLIVRDDSVLMNREEETEVFEGRSDSDLASEMFGRFPTIGPTDIEPTDNTAPATVKRGTPIQFLRELARVHGYLAYVLPGDERGQSIGCFRPPSSAESNLPPLVLLGEGRSLVSAEFSDNSEGPERTRASTMRISDQQVVSAERSFQDQELMGDLPQVSGDPGALRQLPPEQNTREDPEAETESQTRAASYSLRMSADLLPGCYDTIISPYRTVTLRAGDLPYSGDWLIHKVTHRINTSVYSQAIEAKRNAVSDTEAGAGPLDLSAANGVF